MQLYGMKLEAEEAIEINGKKYTKLTSNFLRTDNQKLYFYYDHQNETFTDRCLTCLQVTNAHAGFAVIDWVAARYHCQRWRACELRSEDPEALIQAMLAVYSWCEMKEWLNND